MRIVRDEGDERQRRVDLMVDEFRRAQSRRLAKPATVTGGAQVVEFQRDASAHAASRVNGGSTYFTLV